ncbi:MAG: hypothetical protein ABDH28_03730 [Brevinematia bacterium]
MEQTKENQLVIQEKVLDPKRMLLKDIELLIYNLKRFVDTYSEIGNVSQQTIHLIRTKSLKLSSTVRSIHKLHNVKILKRFYIYTKQISKCFGKIRDMDVMIGLLNNEKSPRSLVKDFSNRRHRYMKEAYKKVSKVTDKYANTINEFIEEISNPKYILHFKDVHKIYKIITNEYQFAKLSFMLEPSYELFNRVRARVKNMKYSFWLLRMFFSDYPDKKFLKDLEESLKAINDFQKSLSYFRDVMTLVNILSKTSLRVSRKKDFVDAFLNARKNIWKDTVENFKERHIRIDYRINNIQRYIENIHYSLHQPEISRYERVMSYIEAFVSEHKGDLEKSRKIANLAIGIYRSFDKFNLIVSDPSEEFIIKGACLIHDVGKSISPELYHKASMETFVASEIHEIKTKEKLMIALVTRYHTRSIPKYSHKWYTNLKDHDKMLVNKLSGFVRIAFAISRASNFSAELINVDSTRDGIDIVVDCKETRSIDIDDVDKVLLEKMIGMPVRIVVRQ